MRKCAKCLYTTKIVPKAERQRVRAKKQEREGNRKLTKERESALKQDRERDRERELKTHTQYKTLLPFLGGGCKSVKDY